MVQYTLVGGRSTIWSFDRLDKWKWFSQDTPLISRGVWSILNNRPPTLLFPGSVGCGIRDSVYIFLQVGSPGMRSGAAFSAAPLPGQVQSAFVLFTNHSDGMWDPAWPSRIHRRLTSLLASAIRADQRCSFMRSNGLSLLLNRDTVPP